MYNIRCDHFSCCSLFIRVYCAVWACVRSFCVFAFFLNYFLIFFLLLRVCCCFCCCVFFLFTFYSSSLLLLRFHTRSPFEFVYACVHIVNGSVFFLAIIVPEHFYFFLFFFRTLFFYCIRSVGRSAVQVLRHHPHLTTSAFFFCLSLSLSLFVYMCVYVCLEYFFLFFFFYSFRFISFNLPYYSSVHFRLLLYLK